MKDTKTEILKKFTKQFGTALDYDGGVYCDVQDLLKFISTSLDQVREQTLEEVEREVIGEDLPSVKIKPKETFTQRIAEAKYKNDLRKEQREALTKLKGDKSE